MSTPAAKRRRVDAANVVLRKPFQSPVIRKQVAPHTTPEPSKTHEPTTSKRQLGEPSYSPRPASVSEPRRRLQPRQSIRPLGNLHKTRPASSSPAERSEAGTETNQRPGASGRDAGDDNPFLALVKAHKTAAMDDLIRGLDRQLDVARQAARIEAASEKVRPGEPVDQELRDLIAKWKSASRLAVEELFEIVKGRVASAGGPTALKQMRQRQLAAYSAFDQGLPTKPTTSGEIHNLAFSQQSDFLVEEGSSQGSREVDIAPAEDEEREEFNMAQMLQSLNIAHSLLDYDEKEEKWID